MPWPDESESAVTDPCGDSMKCGICLGIISDPVLLQCSHSFCQSCVAPVRQCPECRQRIRTRAHNRPLAELVGNLRCRCPGRDGPDQCEKDDVPLGKLESHRRECAFTPVECKHDGCTTKLARRRMSRHEASCGYRTIPCPKCDKLLHANQMSHHLSSECKSNLVACEMSQFCDAKVAKYKLDRHVMKCPFCNPKVREVLLRQEAQLTSKDAELRSQRLQLWESSGGASAPQNPALSSIDGPQPVVTLQFFVRIEGRTLVLREEANGTVADALRSAALKRGVDMDSSFYKSSYLSHGSRRLDPAAILKDCVASDVTLEWSQRVGLIPPRKRARRESDDKGSGMQICIKIDADPSPGRQTQSSVLIDAEPSDTIKNVKAKLRDAYGYPLEQQILIFAGTALLDDRTLLDYGIDQLQDAVILVLRRLPSWATV